MREALKTMGRAGAGLLVSLPLLAAEPDSAPDPAKDWSGYVAWCSRHAGQAGIGRDGVTCLPVVPPRAETVSPGELPPSVDWEDFRAREAEAEAFRRWRR